MTGPEQLAAAAAAPELSVVLVTPGSFASLRRTVSHLLAQSVRDRIELVLVAPSRAALAPAAEALAAFAGWQVVEVGALHGVGHVRAAGVRVARAPVVVFGEDHSFPQPEWAEALIAAHREDWAAVGPALLNANPESPVSWGALFAGFAPWIGRPPAGPAPRLPWHNSAYKRHLLLAYGARLDDMLDAEGVLQADLRARGHRLYLQPAARTRHLNISRPGAEIAAEFTAGRHFALARRRAARWSPPRRAAAVLLAPAALPVRLLRLREHVRRVADEAELPRGTWAATAMSLAAHAAGEAVGAVFGEGRVLQQRANFEFERERFLAPRDAAALRDPRL